MKSAVNRVRKFCQPISEEGRKKPDELMQTFKWPPPMIYFNCQGKPYVWPKPEK